MKQFHDALTSDSSNYEAFAIKLRIDHPDGGEHVWISDITRLNDFYTGILGNTPVQVGSYKIGDSLKVQRDSISDWMYLNNRRLVGGYTILLIRSRMSKDEQATFDIENEIIVGER